MILPGRWIWERTSGNGPWKAERPHTLLIPSCCWAHCPLPFPSREHHIWAQHGIWELCLLSPGFYRFIRGWGRAGPWFRPGLELPALQIKLVIHLGLFGFRAGRLRHEPRAPLDNGWEHKASREPFLPNMGVWELWGHSWGFLGAAQGWVWGGSGVW